MPRRGRQCRDTQLTASRAGTMLTAVTGTGDYVRRNRAAWDGWAAEYAGPGLRNWSAAEPTWGIWNIAETQAGVLARCGTSSRAAASAATTGTPNGTTALAR
jgi:hypothetical protein